ncbi:MAG: DUF4824 family protein [bacterium]
MKKFLSSRGLFVSGFILLVLINIIVLSGVAYNRSGDPAALIWLTERELKMSYRSYEENSGLSLCLDWRTLDKNEEYRGYSSRWGSPGWFSAEKLEELGFNLGDYYKGNDKRSYYRSPIEKEVFIVLENDGSMHQEAIARSIKNLEKKKASLQLNTENKNLIREVETAEKWVEQERITQSRLFAVDAGLDLNKLRGIYEDRARFIIVKGQVKPSRNYSVNNKKELNGYITKLNIEKIHVPLRHRNTLDSLPGEKKTRYNDYKPPRYEIELAYGRRLEPWIVFVNLIGNR